MMGASKRLAELVVQASALSSKVPRALDRPSSFGNGVSAMCWVRRARWYLFRRQIASGGPITLLTDIIRYFMTIPEAAQLVLQASSLAKGGDVFLLDMGEPVRIKDLAEQMLRLSGLSLRDARNPNGDIEIACIGLRPGEKLYEELLIEAESEATKHPLIYRARERRSRLKSYGQGSMPWKGRFLHRMSMLLWHCWLSWCPSGSVMGLMTTLLLPWLSDLH